MLYYIYSLFYKVLKLKKHFLLFILALFIRIFPTYAAQTLGDAILINDGSTNNLSAPIPPGGIVKLGGAHNLTTGSDFHLTRVDINGNTGQTFTISHFVKYGTYDLDMQLHIQENGNITIRDTRESVYVNKGALIARDVKSNLEVAGGNATIRNVLGDVLLSNDAVINQSGYINGTLKINGSALYNGPEVDVKGSLVVNTINLNTNILRNINSHMGVEIIKGITVMRDVTIGDLIAQGGITTIRNAEGNVILTNDAVVNQYGALNHDLNVGGVGLYKGHVNTTDVTGKVTIDTTNVGVNTLHNAAGYVKVIAGKLTMNNAGNDVIVDGVKAVMFVNNITNDVIVKNGGVLSVTGNIGGTLDNDTITAATVNLTGVGMVTNAVGANNSITKITISADRIFSHDGFSVGELNFASDAKVALTTADLAATDITLDNDGIYHIEVNNNQNITGTINATGKAGLDITVKGIRNVDINTFNFKSDLFAGAADQVTLTLGNNFVSGGKLGSQTARLLDTIFDNNALATVSDIYSKDIHINTAKKVKFTGKIVGENIHLGTVDSEAKFTDGAVLDSKIIPTVSGEGFVEFEGKATINADIGAVGALTKSVKFLAAHAVGALPKDAFINSNIFAIGIDAGQTNLVANKNDIKLTGLTKASYLTVDPSRIMTFSGNAVGDALKLVGDTIVVVGVNEVGGALTCGQIVVDDSATLDLTGLTSTTIMVDDSSIGIPVDGRHFILLRKGTGALNGAFKNVTIINKQSLVKWDVLVDANSNVILTQRNDSVNFLTKVLGPKASTDETSNMMVLVNSPNNFQELNSMQTGKAQADMIRRISAKDSTIFVEQLKTLVNGTIRTRTSTLAELQNFSVQNEVINDETTGVSAGDEASRYGAWISSIFSKSIQKPHSGHSGYTASTTGATFGFDTKANDNMIIGAALSLLNTEVKHKDFKSADKTKVDSLMLSIYGMKQITDNWFAQGLITFGSNRVTTNEKRRVSDNDYQSASGQYNSLSFCSEALLGYNYAMEQISITPMSGIRLTRVNDNSYIENGTINQNLSVSKKATNKAELVLGAKVTGAAFDLNRLLSVTPGIHAFINHDIIRKNPKVKSRLLNGGQVVNNTAKPTKTLFNAGVSLSATYYSIKYGLAYDAYLANKYIGYQGTLKIGIVF